MFEDNLQKILDIAQEAAKSYDPLARATALTDIQRLSSTGLRECVGKCRDLGHSWGTISQFINVALGARDTPVNENSLFHLYTSGSPIVVIRKHVNK